MSVAVEKGDGGLGQETEGKASAKVGGNIRLRESRPG